jgi:non-ribosomal peptide synthetase component F
MPAIPGPKRHSCAVRRLRPTCNREPRSLAGLRRIFAGGEALTAAAVRTLDDRFPDGGDPRLINLCGPTEAAVDVTRLDCADHDRRRPVPLGNLRLRILLPGGRPALVGVAGELYLSGVGLARLGRRFGSSASLSLPCWHPSG